MRPSGRLGFAVPARDIRNDILVPRYYDPSIPDRLGELSRTHELVAIADLMSSGRLSLTQGNYIGKMHYGTGPFPYIRTSDIANWELRSSPKHGVTRAVYERFAKKQGIREGDVLLVHEGTYLIGTPCLITRYDTQIIIQHHLAKLRLIRDDDLSPPLLMALLLCPIVQKQIRSKQLTADIIDSIVGRLPEVVLPIPKSPEHRNRFADEAMSIFEGRAEARLRLSATARGLDDVLQAGSTTALDELTKTDLGVDSSVVSFLGDRRGFSSFTIPREAIRRDILIPRYYDPFVADQLEALSEECDLVSVGELAEQGILELQTGHEVGKLAYGSGPIPFIRTSDLGNWELKHDPKQSVSSDVFTEYSDRQSVRADDIFLVRDGTYLVGVAVMVREEDLPLLYCGGVYRIRVSDPARLNPFFLLALLNTEVVRRQIRNKQFTRDVIDTLGRRIEEIQLPIPRNADLRNRIGEMFRQLLDKRAQLRRQASELGAAVEAAAAAPRPSSARQSSQRV